MKRQPNHKQHEKEQEHHAVDDDTALRLYALLKDLDTELEKCTAGTGIIQR